jgi:hypothetical protein
MVSRSPIRTRAFACPLAANQVFRTLLNVLTLRVRCSPDVFTQVNNSSVAESSGTPATALGVVPDMLTLGAKP